MDDDLRRAGGRWRAFAYALNLTRFSVLTLLAGAGALMVADQGRDLLIAINDGYSRGLFQVGMVIWAFSIWLWARTLLDIRFPDAPARRSTYNLMRKHVPRFLGATAFVVTGVGAWLAGAYRLIPYAVIWGGVFLLFVIYRRPLSNILSRSLAGVPGLAVWSDALSAEKMTVNTEPPFDSLRAVLEGPRGKFVILTAALGFALFLAGWFIPVSVGTVLGGVLLFFLWGATWLPLGSVVTYFGNRWGIPVLLILLILAAVFSAWNDNHQIRQLAGVKPDARPSVEQAVADWKERNGCVGTDCPPFIVVATAGGGIRAAYWTAAVLGHLHDTHDGFERSLFAISGVSGGSVGAAVFRALITAAPDDGGAAVPRGRVMDRGLDVLGRDLLAPVMVSMLFPDLTQRFLPLPLLPDRARAFELGLEAAYAESVQGRDAGRPYPMTGSLAALNDRGPSPALFLNATWVADGRRIVGSNLAFSRGRGSEHFVLANDFMALAGFDMRLSTAAHNSARFPVVSPAGLWRADPADPDSAVQGRLQDGGLFENFGAETALEILRAACSLTPVGLNPRVILISSDPTLPDDIEVSPRNPPMSFAYELATLVTYANTRVGRGAEAATRLIQWAQEEGGDDGFVHFRMCVAEDPEGTGRDPAGSEASPPLGWALSTLARDTIRGYLLPPDTPGLPEPPCRAKNRHAMEIVGRWLGDAP